MALTLDTRSLFSTVKNTSGKTKIFGFLPPHGKELANNEEFSCFGHITEAVRKGDYAESRRNMHALQAAIQRGDLDIIQTPNPILEDVEGQLGSKMVVNHRGTLTLFSTSWDASYFSEGDPEV